MSERRRVTRLKTFKGGAIIHGTAPPLECLIRNLSASGACLEIASYEPLPAQFTLLIRPEMVKRSCRLIWRAADRAGVAFAPRD